jgi:hypothetical protein
MLASAPLGTVFNDMCFYTQNSPQMGFISASLICFFMRYEAYSISKILQIMEIK